MPFTYSESSGLTEAVSQTSITNILSIIPDNTSELISPRDVRDAIYSNWEHGGVIRWNTLSGSDYLGVSQNNIKDFKLFLGKKQLSGSDIMNSTLLSNDTDIFFYNTKSDSSSQDLKIGFLAGDSLPLHLSGPYIEVQQVASPSSLNFNISHNQASGGDFNFVAGLGGNIVLNSLTFPTQTEFTSQVISPTSSVANDFFLTSDTSGNIYLKKAVSITGSITVANNLQIGTSSIIGGTQWGVLFEDNAGKLSQSSEFIYNTSLNELSFGSSFSVSNYGTASVNDIKINSGISFQSGSSSSVGTVSLVGGSASVISSLVDTNSIIICTRQNMPSNTSLSDIKLEKFTGSFSVYTSPSDNPIVGYVIFNTF